LHAAAAAGLAALHAPLLPWRHALLAARPPTRPPAPPAPSDARAAHRCAAGGDAAAAPPPAGKPKRTEEELEDLVEKFMREQAEKESGGAAPDTARRAGHRSPSLPLQCGAPTWRPT
jgi:hypothetical protein